LAEVVSDPKGRNLVYIADLEVFRYHSGPFDPANWSVPLRAVGWLEHPQTLSLGTAPSELVAKLKAMVKQSREAYSQYCFRGLKHCSLCAATGLASPGPIWSQENIFVPGIGVVYVAPGGVPHYVEVHDYLPPSEFIDAVLRCPDCLTNEYRLALRAANRGSEPPLEDHETYTSKFSESLKRIRDRSNP
jgi:hypothetical protein